MREPRAARHAVEPRLSFDPALPDLNALSEGERRPAGAPLRLTGNSAEDKRRRTMWRRTYGGSTEPLPPRDRDLAELRHRRNVLDDAIALERKFEWERTTRRLQAVGITTR